MTNTTNSAKPRDLVFTRVFDAPVEQVWKAWVEPEVIMQWWGPEGFTSPSARMDFRERGTSQLAVTEYDWTVGHMMEMSRMGMEQCLDKMAAIFAKT